MNRAARSTLALLTCATLAGGCGAGDESAAGTAGSSTSAPTSAAATITNTRSPADDAHPIDSPANLRADDALRAELRDRAEAFARTQEGAGGAKLRGPFKGTTYYAGWGGYEYAQASFAVTRYPVTEGDPTGSFYREVGGDWVAFDFGTYSDVTPICSFPLELRELWYPGFGSDSCGSTRDRRTTFADVAARVRCVLAAAPAASGAASLDCAHFPERSDTTSSASARLVPGQQVVEGEPVELDTYINQRLPYGIATKLRRGGLTFTCTALPDEVACTHGDQEVAVGGGSAPAA